MRHIKNIVTLIVISLTTFCGNAQLEVRDNVLNGQKAALAVLIAGLDVEKKLIGDSYIALAREEEKWRDKLNEIAAPEVGSVYGQVAYNVYIAIPSIVTRIENKITAIKILRPFYWQIKQLEGELAREKLYMDRIRDDTALGSVPGLVPRLTGGQGYSYTFTLQLFLRMKRIKSKLLKLEYKVSNLSVLTRVF